MLMPTPKICHVVWGTRLSHARSITSGRFQWRTFNTQWRLCINRLSCWSALSLSRSSASPARDVALKFEGSSTSLCSLESYSFRRLRVMRDAICLPFCSVNTRGRLYITVCGLVLVKQYLCLCNRVCMFVYCKQQSGQ